MRRPWRWRPGPLLQGLMLVLSFLAMCIWGAYLLLFAAAGDPTRCW